MGNHHLAFEVGKGARAFLCKTSEIGTRWLCYRVGLLALMAGGCTNRLDGGSEVNLNRRDPGGCAPALRWSNESRIL